MDEVDRKILSVMAVNARTSFRDIAQHVHRSPNAAAERVRRLQSTGVIRGFLADLDRAHLGFPLEAWIDVKLRPGTTAQSFEAFVCKTPGVVRCHSDRRL